MKKQLWKKSLAVFTLAAAMTAITACGNTSSKGEDQKKQETQQQNEYVYQSSFQDIDVDDIYVSGTLYKEGTLYMLGSKWVEDKDSEYGGKSYQYFITCAADGSDLQKNELEGLKKNENFTNMIIDDKGQIRMLTQIYKYNEKTQKSKSSYHVHTLNEKGKIKDSVELKREKKSSNNEYDEFYLSSGSIAFLDDKIYVAVNSTIYSFNEKGKETKTYELENYIDRLIQTPDGTIYVYGYTGEKYGLKEFNTETGKLGEAIEFKDYNIYNVNSVSFGEGNDIYLNDRSDVYKIDTSNGKIEVEFNWLNNDIDGDSISNCFFLENGKFLTINSFYDQDSQKDKTELVTMNKIKASEVKEKEIIHFSCAYLNYTVKEKILDFNKKSDKYHVEVKSYEAYEDREKQMNLDITSGNMPDILDVSNGISKEQMIKKGIFTDLYALMEKDEEIKKEDFVPSVLSALETDGKLYYLSPYFTVGGFIASKKNVGDMEGWSMDDMEELYKKTPKDGVFMQYMTKQWFVQSILEYQIKDYIDWSSGEVKFDSDDFVKLLEFANNFPDEEEYDYNNHQSMPTLVKKGKLMLDSLSLYSPEEIELYTKLYKKHGGYTILAFPSADKSNQLPIALSGGAMAITEQCENKEGAWEFLRQLYTYEYQKNSTMYGGFPTRKDALDKKLEYAQATEAFTDEDGTEVQPIDSGYGYDDYQVDLGPISKEEVDIIYSMIDRIGLCTSYNTVSEDIYNIINEETKAFFAGDKSAKDTADVIQSRVKIYVSENS